MRQTLLHMLFLDVEPLTQKNLVLQPQGIDMLMLNKFDPDAQCKSSTYNVGEWTLLSMPTEVGMVSVQVLLPSSFILATWL